MLTVADFMIANVLFANPDQSIHDAFLLLKEAKTRYLPVVDGFRVVGVLSISDIKLHATVRDEELVIPPKKVADIMARNIVTCNKYWSLEKAAKVMAKQGVGCLPVVHEGELVGLITARELLLGLTGETARIDEGRSHSLGEVESPWFMPTTARNPPDVPGDGDFGARVFV